MTTAAGSAPLVVMDTAGDLTMGGVLAVTGTGNSYILGNVGIGTTSPLTKLSIQGTVGANDLLNIASSTGTSLMYINSAGNVGIGTTAPGSLLELYSAIPVLSINGTTLNAARGINFQWNGTTYS